jgi:hypothetical protein
MRHPGRELVPVFVWRNRTSGKLGTCSAGTCGGHKQPWRTSGGPRQDLGVIQGTPRFRSAPVVPVAIPDRVVGP